MSKLLFFTKKVVHHKKTVAFQQEMPIHALFESVANIASDFLAGDDVYQADMQFAKEQMLVSLSWLKLDPTFLAVMNKIGINYGGFEESQLENIRNDIWSIYAPLLNVVYFITNDNVELFQVKEPLLKYCTQKYIDLINYLLSHQYIPPINPEGYGYSFWSSKMGQHEASRYVVQPDIKERYLMDSIVSKYYARILCGWRPEDIQEVSQNSRVSLNVTYDFLRYDKPKRGYEALSKFYWQAYSQAYANFIPPGSKVTVFIQDGFVAHSLFMNAELPVLRKKEVSIQVVFLKKQLQMLLFQYNVTYNNEIYPLSEQITAIRYLRKTLIICTKDGTLFQLSKNNGDTQGDYFLSFLRIADKLSFVLPKEYIYTPIPLSKKDVLNLFNPRYTATWENYGSPDSLSPQGLFVRRMTHNSSRGDMKMRGLLIDKSSLIDKKIALEITSNLSKNYHSDYCLYVACNASRVSLWQMSYEALFAHTIDVFFESANHTKLMDWAFTHHPGDVLYYQEGNVSSKKISWKKMLLLNENKVVHLTNVQEETELFSLLDEYKNTKVTMRELMIKLRHLENRHNDTQLFGAKFVIQELISAGEDFSTIMQNLQEQFNDVARQVNGIKNREEILRYIDYDIHYEMNQQISLYSNDVKNHPLSTLNNDFYSSRYPSLLFNTSIKNLSIRSAVEHEENDLTVFNRNCCLRHSREGGNPGKIPIYRTGSSPSQE